ncbi:unnamed protein product, partial [Urochloa humidicola]
SPFPCLRRLPLFTQRRHQESRGGEKEEEEERREKRRRKRRATPRRRCRKRRDATPTSLDPLRPRRRRPRHRPRRPIAIDLGRSHCAAAGHQDNAAKPKNIDADDHRFIAPEPREEEDAALSSINAVEDREHVHRHRARHGLTSPRPRHPSLLEPAGSSKDPEDPDYSDDVDCA